VEGTCIAVRPGGDIGGNLRRHPGSGDGGRSESHCAALHSRCKTEMLLREPCSARSALEFVVNSLPHDRIAQAVTSVWPAHVKAISGSTSVDELIDLQLAGRDPREVFNGPLIVNAVGLGLLLVSPAQWAVAFLVFTYLVVISRPQLLRADREAFADTLGIVRLRSREEQTLVLRNLVSRFTDYCDLTDFPRWEWFHRLRNVRRLLAKLENGEEILKRPMWLPIGSILIDAPIIVGSWYAGSLVPSANIWFFSTMAVAAAWFTLQCRRFAWKCRSATEDVAMTTAGDSILSAVMRSVHRGARLSPDQIDERVRAFNKSLACRISGRGDSRD
jgi:hypothetical protein